MFLGWERSSIVDARVQCGLLHMYESIPWKWERVESVESLENVSGKESNGGP
jgi:hypothetical protein